MEKAPRSGGSTTFDVGGGERDLRHELLSHSYRRFVLSYLGDVDGPQPISKVAAELGAWQAGLPPTERSATDIEDIELTLYHNHLPRMFAANVIEYGPTRETVTLASRAHEMSVHLDETGGE